MKQEIEYTDNQLAWASEEASALFEQEHELPSEAHPRDREDWEEAKALELLAGLMLHKEVIPL